MPAHLGADAGFSARLSQQLEIVPALGCLVRSAPAAVPGHISCERVGERQLSPGPQQPRRERDRVASPVVMIDAHDHLSEHGLISLAVGRGQDDHAPGRRF